MSKTGTNSALKPFVDLRGIQRVKRSPAPSYITGFTLVEVLVTTAVLSLGIVLIYRAFFTLLDSFGYYSNYLRVIAFADEKLGTRLTAQQLTKLTDFKSLIALINEEKFEND